MQITIDTNNLSELDINMLAFLAGQEATEPEGDEPDAPDETPAPVKPAKAPAKKAAAKVEPTVEEDLVGGGDTEPEPDAPTMSDAVAAATKLVSSGGSAKVKAALETVGAKRVSEMAETDIPAFLAALEG